MDGDQSSELMNTEKCTSCGYSSVENDSVVDKLKHDLVAQESKIKTLEGQIAQQTESFGSVLEEKTLLETEVSSLKKKLEEFTEDSEEQEFEHGGETHEALLMLQEQILFLHEEKKRLNAKIGEFECDTEELSNIFRLQQEKFEQDLGNKDRVINVLENERKLMEKDGKNVRNELEKARQHNDSMKKHLEQVKVSLQEKDAAIVNFSELHNEAIKQQNNLQEELVLAEERFKKELAYRENLEGQLGTISDKNVLLNDEIQQLKKETSGFNSENVNLKSAGVEMKNKLDHLKNIVAHLEKEKEEVDVEVTQLKGKHDKLNKETECTKSILREVESLAEERKINIQKLESENKLLHEEKSALEKKLEQLLVDTNRMDEKLLKQEQEKNNLKDCLEATEENLEVKFLELSNVLDEVESLKDVIEKLNMVGKQQKETLDRTKEELDLLTSAQEIVDEEYNKLKENNASLNERLGSLSKENENLHASCESKTTQNEELANDLNKKEEFIATLQAQEQKLQREIDDLLANEANRGIELKNAREEIGNLLRENKTIDEHFQKVNLQLQECLGLLDEKREEYLAGKTRLEEQIRKHQEETSRFCDHNTEINRELTERRNEIVSLTMEKQELVRIVENLKNEIQMTTSRKIFLEDELCQVNKRFEEHKEKERQTLGKKNETQAQLVEVEKVLQVEQEEKQEMQYSLTTAREDVQRWKKISQEYKEERNRLQRQIEDLDQDLNEKKMYFSEEKSTLEKNVESLRNVVKRLKCNEEILRNKIEELRADVDQLSEVKSDQQSQIRNLTHEKNRLMTSVADYNKMAEEQAKLMKENDDVGKENRDLKKEVDALQTRNNTVEEQNERLLGDIEELRRLVEASQTNLQETNRKFEETKNEAIVLRDSNSEITDEKQRLLNENCRLKERKNAMLQERNKLQDMIESLDKCHSEKNENLTQKIAVLEKELVTIRQTLKSREIKEVRLGKELYDLNEKCEEDAKQNSKIQGTLKKVEGENVRLRKKIGELGKELEEKERESDENIHLKVALQEEEQKTKKLQDKEKVLNVLIREMNQQQNQHKEDIRRIERASCELKSNLGIEGKEKEKLKETITRIEEELRSAKCNQLVCMEQLQNEKEQNSRRASLVSRLEKEKNDLKELIEKNDAIHKEKMTELKAERCNALKSIQQLENQCSEDERLRSDLNLRLQTVQENIHTLTSEKMELESNCKESNEKIAEFTKEIETLEKENQNLLEHAQNLEKMFATKDSAISDRTSGMEKEINVLRDTLSQLRNSAEVSRKENDEIKRKLEKEKNEKYDAELQVNEMRLKRERLEGKNDELINNCTKLEELVKLGAQIKFEKEECEKSLETERLKTERQEKELQDKIQELVQLNNEREHFKDDIINCKQSIVKLKTAKQELQELNSELALRNEKSLQDFDLLNEKYQQVALEKQHLVELIRCNKEELENLNKDICANKAEFEQKIQQLENEKSQIEDCLNINEETLVKLAEKQQKLQDDLRKSREEMDDLESENEDLVTELEQSKEQYKKVKESLCILQAEHGDLQDELREKENQWSTDSEKSALENFEMETKITNLTERLENAHERTEKQRELEKILRHEIEELSDAYVKLEEEVHHCNKENISLKEKVQELSQDIDELELARDTACLLKEKRHAELLKTEKNIQRLEKNLKEKQKSNKRLNKDLDGMMEKQKILELQISTEKDISSQRLKQVDDLQDQQRNLEEELWHQRQNKEKQDAEIETWRLNSDSMKLRIEMLEEEFKNMTSEKESLSQDYENCQYEKHNLEDEIGKLTEDQTNFRAFHQEQITKFSQQSNELQAETTELRAQLREQKSKLNTLKDSYDHIFNKCEASGNLVLELKKDMKKKDGRIDQLEKRKREMVNLLADLDIKIGKIQIQASDLENENKNLSGQLAAVTGSEELWKETVDQQCKEFSEKFQTESREKQQLEDMKEHYLKLHQNAEGEVQATSTQLRKLRGDHERLVSENIAMKESKKALEEVVLEKSSSMEHLKQNLTIERNKTAKLEAEIAIQLDETDCLKNELEGMKNDFEKCKTDLKEAKKSCKEIEENLGSKNKELVKTQDILKNTKLKTKEYQDTLTKAIFKHNDVLEGKDQTIGTVTKENQELSKIVNSVTSKLHQSEQEVIRYQNEMDGLKNGIEEKEKLVNDLQVSYKNIVNTNESLDSERVKVTAKMKQIAKALAKLELEHEHVLLENEKLVSKSERQASDSSERINGLYEEKKTLQENLEDQEKQLENLKTEINIFRQKNVACLEQIEKSAKTIENVQQKLFFQEQENESLKKALKKSNTERDELDDVSQRVSAAMDKLRNEAMSSHENNVTNREPLYATALENENQTFDGNLHRLVDKTATNQQKTFALETSFSQIESEVSSLRAAVTQKAHEINHVKSLLSSTKKERDKLDVELIKQVKRCDFECQNKEKLDDCVIKMKHENQTLKEEKEHSINEWRERNLVISKKNAELVEEITFLKNNNSAMVTQKEEIERKVDETDRNIRSLNENLQSKEIKITKFKEELSKLEEMNKELKAEHQRNMNLLEKRDQKIQVLSEELCNLGTVWKENTTLLRKLEGEFFELRQEEDDNEEDQINSQNDLLHIHSPKTDPNIGINKKSLSELQSRFNGIFAAIAEQKKTIESMQVKLVDTKAQWDICLGELQDRTNEKKNLEMECLTLKKQLSIFETNHKDSMVRADELASTLNVTKTKFAESKALQEEENERISQELNQMQAELTVSCDKFNKLTSKSKMQEEALETKDKYIIEIEDTLQKSRKNERVLTIRKTELETKNEIHEKTITVLEESERELQKTANKLESVLRNERELRERDIAEKESVITQLKMKLEDAEQQLSSIKELQVKTSKTLNELEEECRNLQRKLGSKCEEYDQLNKNNTELKKYVQKLEMELDQTETNFTQSKNKTVRLEEDLETMKEKETQQQYQYRVLEKEKEILENEAAFVDETAERLTQRIEKSLDDVNQCNSDEKLAVLNDSGIDIDSSYSSMMTSREPLGRGVFEKTMAHAENNPDESFSTKHLRCLEAAVEKSVQVMFAFNKNCHEKTRLFKEKEEHFLSEINILKKTVDHNDDVRSVLEKEIQRLDDSQKAFQHTIKQENEEKTTSLEEIAHLKSLLLEKEKYMEMLNLCVQNSKKRQESLQDKLDSCKKDLEQEQSERMKIENTNQIQEQNYEELRQNCLKSDIENQAKLENLDTKIYGLETDLLEARNLISVLENDRDKHLKINMQLHADLDKVSTSVKNFEIQLKESEENTRKAKSEILDISKRLQNSEHVVHQLKKSNEEITEAYNKVNKDLSIVSSERDRISEELSEAEKRIHKITLEYSSLNNAFIASKESFNEKCCECSRISVQLSTTENLLRKSEDKLKTIGCFLEQINKCKDELEAEIDDAKRTNGELKNINKSLKNENESLTLELIKSKKECNQLENRNTKQSNHITTVDHALQEANEELNTSSTQVKNLNNTAKTLQHLLDHWPSEHSKEFENNTRLNSSAQINHEKQEDTSGKASISQQLFSLNGAMDTIFEECHKRVLKQQDLLTELSQKKISLEKIEEEYAKHHEKETHLQNTVKTLSQKSSKLEQSCEIYKDDLKKLKVDVCLKNKTTAELTNVNRSLRDQNNRLETEVSSSRKVVEELRKERSKSKKDILATQNEVTELKSQCEGMEVLRGELEVARWSVKELKEMQNKSMMEKDDARLEVDYFQRKLRHLETEQVKEKEILRTTQSALEAERERIATVTKVARIKENDLEAAKMTIKSKEERIEQHEKQVTEIRKQGEKLQQELSDTKESLQTAVISNRTLEGENKSLKEKCLRVEHDFADLEKEKETMEDENMEQKRRVTVLVADCDKQKDDNKKLADEIKTLTKELNLNHITMQKLESENQEYKKSTEENEEKHRMRHREFVEKCVVSDSKIIDLEKSLFQVKSDLNREQQQNTQLTTTLSDCNHKYAELIDHNTELEGKLKTHENDLTNLREKNGYLSLENNDLKKSKESCRNEIREINRNLAASERRLTQIESDLQHKHKETIHLGQTLSSRNEIIKNIGKLIVRSNKQIQELYQNDETANGTYSSIEYETPSIISLDSMTSSDDDLFSLGQTLEKKLHDDSRLCGSFIEKMKHENKDLRNKINEKEEDMAKNMSTIEKLNERLQVSSQTNVEVTTMLTAARLALQKVTNNVASCSEKIKNIHMKSYVLQKELSTVIQDNQIIKDYQEPFKQHSIDIFNESNLDDSCATDRLLPTFKELESYLDETNDSVRRLLEIHQEVQKDREEMISKNFDLLGKIKEKESSIQHYEEVRNLLELKCKQHEIRESKLDRSVLEIKAQRDTLNDKFNEMKNSTSNEREETKEIVNEISSLTQEKHNLTKRIQELEVTLQDAVSKYTELMSTQQKMGETQKELEDAHQMVCKENKELHKEMLTKSDKVVALQTELEASRGTTDMLQKRYSEKCEVNTALAGKIETQSEKIAAFERTLEQSTSQAKDMNRKIGHLNEQINQKDDMISHLEKELGETQKDLDERKMHIQHLKEINESSLCLKQEIERRLRATENSLKTCEQQLNEEKKLSGDLKMEKGKLILELDTRSTRFTENVSDLMSQISLLKANEAAVNQELSSKKEAIIELENELSLQDEKRRTIDDNRNAIGEKLNSIKIQHSCLETQLDQRLKENKKLQDDKKNLKQQVQNLEMKLQKEWQDNLIKMNCKDREIERFGVQRTELERTNQIRENDFQELHMKCSNLRERNETTRLELAKIVNEKEKEIEELRLSCDAKEEAITNLSEKHVAEKNKTEKLQEEIVQANKKLVETTINLGQVEIKQKEISRQAVLLYQTITDYFKFLDCEKGIDSQDVDQTLQLLFTALEQIKKHSNQLQAESSQAKERKRKIEADRQTTIAEKTQLRNELQQQNVQVEQLQNDFQVIKSSFENCQETLQKKNVENQLLRKEIIQAEEKEKGLCERIENMENEHRKMLTEIGVIEGRSLALEESLRLVEAERNEGQAKTKKMDGDMIELRYSCDELNKRNSSLLEHLTNLQKRAKTDEDLLTVYVNDNKTLQKELSKAGQEALSFEKLNMELKSAKEDVQKRYEEEEKRNQLLKAQLKEMKEINIDLNENISKLTKLNKEATDINTELKQDKAVLQTAKESLETELCKLRRKIDRIDNEQSGKLMEKTRLQNQLDETFTSLERQQTKLSQALNDKEVLQIQLLEAERELKILMEDNAVLNQQGYRNHKNIFSSPEAQELSQTKTLLVELRRKGLSLSQENRLLLETLREKSDELRAMKLKEMESRKEVEQYREKMRVYLGDRDRWEDELKSVITQIGVQTNNGAALESVNNSSQRTDNNIPMKNNNF